MGELKQVYLLVHEHHDEGFRTGVSDKVIGFYSSPEQAEETIKYVVQWEGFRDFPLGFVTKKIPVDSLMWPRFVEIRD